MLSLWQSHVKTGVNSLTTGKNILLKGYYDFFNFGDELLLLSMVDFFRDEFVDNNQAVTLFIERQKKSIEALNYDTLPLHEFQEPIKGFVKQQKANGMNGLLLKLCTNALFMLAFFDAILFRLTGNAIFFKKLFKFYQELDVIHYIGGGYFTSIWDFSIAYVLYELLSTRLAKLVNPRIELVASGLGIGPLTSNAYNQLFKRFIAPFTAIHVREHISLKHVKNLGFAQHAACLGDDVQMFLPLFQQYKEANKEIREQQKIFGINLKYDKEHDYTELKGAIQTLVTTLIEDGWQVSFFSFGTDHAVLNTLDEHVREKLRIHKPYEEGMHEFLTHFSQMRAGLGFAYHFSVLSSLFEIPALNIYVGEYYKQKIGEVIKKLSPSQKILSDQELIQSRVEDLLDGYTLNDKQIVYSAYEKMRSSYKEIYQRIFA